MTDFLKLTLLTANQNDKELTANAALQRIERATQRWFDADFGATASLALTQDQFASNFVFECSNLSGDGTLTVPNSVGGGANTAQRTFAVRNSDSGGSSVSVQASGGSLVVLVAPGDTALVVSDSTEVYRVGPPGTMSINTQTGTSYTLVLEDGAPRYIRMNNGSANTLTVPPSSSVDFPIGTQIPVFQAGAGQTTIAEGTGVTVNTPETLNLRKQNSSAVLTKVDSDAWDLAGDLEAAP